MATVPTTSIADRKPSEVLEAGQRLQNALAHTHLHIVDAQKQFDTRTTSTDESIKLSLTWDNNGGLVDPAAVNLDLTAQLVSGFDAYIYLRAHRVFDDRHSFANSSSSTWSRRRRTSTLRSS